MHVFKRDYFNIRKFKIIYSADLIYKQRLKHISGLKKRDIEIFDFKKKET